MYIRVRFLLIRIYNLLTTYFLSKKEDFNLSLIAKIDTEIEKIEELDGYYLGDNNNTGIK